MQILIKKDDRVLAIHEGRSFTFSTDALLAIERIPNTPTGGRMVVGMYLDDDFQKNEVLWGDEYHMLIKGALKQPMVKMISAERLAELEDTDEKMDALISGGVDNWEWYGESLKEYWKAKEEAEEAASTDRTSNE